MKLKEIVIAMSASLALAAPAMAAGDRQQSTHQQGASPQSSGAHTSMGEQSQQDSSRVRQVQQALKDKGFDVGQVDGIMGQKTQSALREFQEKEGMQASGTLDQQTLSALGIQASGATGTGAGAKTGSSSSVGSSDRTSGSQSGGMSGSAAQSNTSGGASTGAPGGTGTMGGTGSGAK